MSGTFGCTCNETNIDRLDLKVDFKVYALTMYRIGELAEKVGVSPPTLRYYEQIGLVHSSARSPSGYRLYDSSAEARLRFIARAKRLGLSLDEIRDLVEIWRGGNCSTTRAHLRHLVAHKIAEVRDQVEDLATFGHQLEAVYDRIAEEVASHGCNAGCDCVPELPHTAKITLTDELQLIQTSECSCGGACGATGCRCGCNCCANNEPEREGVTLHD